MRQILLLTTLICLSSSAYSKGCRQFNLFETNKNLNEMPIQNQGNFNTCYAHSLSAAYEVKTGLPLHPYSVAYTHKKRSLHWKPKNLNYSFSAFAWSDIRKKGSCLKEDIAPKIKYYLGDIPYNDDQFFYAVRVFFKHKNYSDTYNELLKDPFNRGVPWKDSDLQTLFSKIPIDKAKDFFEFLGDYIFNDCEKIYPHELVKTYGLGLASNHKLSNKIDEILSENQPAIVGFCIEQLRNDPSKKPSSPRIIMPIKKSCGAHYALIAGEDMIDNKCQLLIRNSYSEGFWGEEKQTCYCENENGERSLCHRQNFDPKTSRVLGCYYDKEDFLRQTFEISKIE